MLDGRGIALGPSFRGLHAIWRGDVEALAVVVVPEALVETADGLPIHPAALNSCFQLLGATFTGEGTRSAERRVGKESVSTCRSRRSPYHKTIQETEIVT